MLKLSLCDPEKVRYFSFTRKQKAAKSHFCSRCEAMIVAGEEYTVTFSGVAGGGGRAVGHLKLCQACAGKQQAKDGRSEPAPERKQQARKIPRESEKPVWVEGRGWVVRRVSE